MISELFGLLSSIDVERSTSGKMPKFSMNINKNRIRSISAFSSNSIFYFPMIVSDQNTPEEIGMISRMIEKSYASFVVACISLMPFHRIKADDRASVEEYLAQFHQNIGMNGGSGATMNKVFGYIDKVNESVDSEDANLKSLQNYLLETWNTAKSTNSDFVSIVAKDISLNDMYNESALDIKTQLLQERYMAVKEELDTWGFLGEASEDMMDTEDLADMSDDEIEQSCQILNDSDEPQRDPENQAEKDLDSSLMSEGAAQAVNSVKFVLEGISENKILSCQSLTKLSAMESKLKGLRGKYAKYLNRYKRKYKENQKTGSKAKLAIRFNKMTISDPKAFMQQYGTFIKIINKRLRLIDRRRAELRKRKGMPAEKKLEENVITELTSMDLEAVDFCDESITADLNAPDYEVFSIIEDAVHDYQNGKINALEKEARKWHAKYDKEADKNARVSRIEKLRRENEARSPKQTSKGELNKASSSASSGDTMNPASDIVPSKFVKSGGAESIHVFDKDVFTDMDMKKANEAVPIFSKAQISFIVDGTEEVVSRDVLIGIKAYIHRAPAIELINDVYNCIINKRKFLKFVKFITGEERSLADLLFGFKELRTDALDASKGGSAQWRSAFKSRKRWSKISVPYLTKEYTPNGTVVLTMNEVNYIKEQYGIDIMKPEHIRMLMDADFLLGFVIVDQANEMVYVTYDGHGYGFQQYTYAMLEREQQTSDRMMRELYRSFSR